ncbi:hypothetical protein FKM82_025347 [Ascaphus truei]
MSHMYKGIYFRSMVIHHVFSTIDSLQSNIVQMRLKYECTDHKSWYPKYESSCSGHICKIRLGNIHSVHNFSYRLNRSTRPINMQHCVPKLELHFIQRPVMWPYQ